MKYWDVIPPKKNEQSLEEKMIEFLRKKKLEPYKVVVPYLYKNTNACLHKNCPNCHGTGHKSWGGVCIHMISCPCPSCSPSMHNIQYLDYIGSKA